MNQELLQATTYLVEIVREKITDDSDVVWTSYDTPQELRAEIDRLQALLQQGSMEALNALDLHFAPTGTFQEHSLSNGWGDEYIGISTQFENLYMKLKTDY